MERYIISLTHCLLKYYSTERLNFTQKDEGLPSHGVLLLQLLISKLNPVHMKSFSQDRWRRRNPKEPQELEQVLHRPHSFQAFASLKGSSHACDIYVHPLYIYMRKNLNACFMCCFVLHLSQIVLSMDKFLTAKNTLFYCFACVSSLVSVK